MTLGKTQFNVVPHWHFDPELCSCIKWRQFKIDALMDYFNLSFPSIIARFYANFFLVNFSNVKKLSFKKKLYTRYVQEL